MSNMRTLSVGRVLLVEDDDGDAGLVTRHLVSAFPGVQVVRHRRLDQALAAIDRGNFDVILMDLGLPDASGEQGLQDLLAVASCPVIVVTGDNDPARAMRALARGAQDYVDKNAVYTTHALERIVRYSIARFELVQVRERERRLLSILEHVPVGVYVVNADGRPYYVNQAGTEILGRGLHPDASPESLAEIYQAYVAGTEEAYPTERMPIVRALHGEESFVEDMAIHAPDGIKRLSVRGYPIVGEAGATTHAVAIFEDFTERFELQRELQHSQKIDALGRLAGGVAHDFNNLLTAILSFASFANEALEAQHVARKDIAQIVRAAERATELTRALLAYSRKSPHAPTALELTEALRGMLPLLDCLLTEDVELTVEIEDDLGSVELAPEALEQVLLNLIVNARDAMPKGGSLRLTASRSEISTLKRVGTVTLAAGSYARIDVEDDGDGIPPELIEKIYEPFFTTKEPGKGTGLGLSTCFGVVTQAGGALSAISTPGRGSTFSVWFPQTDATSAHYSAKRAGTASERGRILVVEDDEVLRAIAARALRAHGHEVALACDGKQALALLRMSDGFDLVMTDVVMPNMSGPELVAKIHQTNPGTRVIFMSGHPLDTLERYGISNNSVQSLPKPFSPDTLIAAVSDALEPSGARARRLADG